MKLTLLRQRGIALPVMLMIMLMMLVTSIFLLKSINSATLMAGNAAYESQLSKAADIGLINAFTWLSTQAKNDKTVLINDVPAQGYVANFNPNWKPNTPQFWDKKISFTDNGDTVDYVIYRLCAVPGAFDQTTPQVNHCVMTAPLDDVDVATPIGSSNVQDSITFPAAPQVHYVITSRISGPRGGNVVNQLVVMIGA